MDRVYDLRELIAEIRAADQEMLIGGKPTTPGVNHYVRTNADGTQSGLMIYMGGSTERGLGPDGKTMTDIPVGHGNQPVAYLTWQTSKSGTGAARKGSTQLWSAQDAPNRGLGVGKLIEAAAHEDIGVSNSTLSVGGETAMVKRANVAGKRSRIDFSKLTYMTGDVLAKHIAEDFMDYVGAQLDERHFMDPDQTLAHRGWIDTDPVGCMRMLQINGEAIKFVHSPKARNL